MIAEAETFLTIYGKHPLKRHIVVDTSCFRIQYR